MVISCAALNCSNRFKKDSGISFHKFPLKNHKLLKKWLFAIRRDKFVPSIHHRLCSIHFTESCFWKSNNRLLKDDSVPSIFNFPARLMKDIDINQVMEKMREEYFSSSLLEPEIGIIEDEPIQLEESDSSHELETETNPHRELEREIDSINEAELSQGNDRCVALANFDQVVAEHNYTTSLRKNIKLLGEELKRKDTLINALRNENQLYKKKCIRKYESK